MAYRINDLFRPFSFLRTSTVRPHDYHLFLNDFLLFEGEQGLSRYTVAKGNQVFIWSWYGINWSPLFDLAYNNSLDFMGYLASTREP
jgi:hypothetical protein